MNYALDFDRMNFEYAVPVVHVLDGLCLTPTPDGAILQVHNKKFQNWNALVLLQIIK